jgi:hypothetical protein
MCPPSANYWPANCSSASLLPNGNAPRHEELGSQLAHLFMGDRVVSEEQVLVGGIGMGVGLELGRGEDGAIRLEQQEVWIVGGVCSLEIGVIEGEPVLGPTDASWHAHALLSRALSHHTTPHHTTPSDSTH